MRTGLRFDPSHMCERLLVLKHFGKADSGHVLAIACERLGMAKDCSGSTTSTVHRLRVPTRS